MTSSQPSGRVRVWDLPTRLFHWALAVCVAGMLATAYAPGHWLEWHARLGYAVATLLLFRLVWGLVGGHWSRFLSFLPWPGQIRAYLQGDAALHDRPGHSPLGALAVFLMLGVLLAQVVTGLVSDDEIGFTGPLNRLVSAPLGLAATSWHSGPGAWLIAGLITAHLLAIGFYFKVRRNNLVSAMLHGDRAADPATPASRDTAGTRLLALGVFALCAAGVYGVVAGVA